MEAEDGGAFAALLERAADPAAASHALDRFFAAADPATLARLHAQPRWLQSLVVIFSHSQFLSEALIQNPEVAATLEPARLADRVIQPEELASDLATRASTVPAGERALALLRWKRRQLLRIALRDLTGRATLAETTLELSNLADTALAQAYAWSWNDLVGRFGLPSGGMVVLALGKLGGEELNYSSDVDLLFLYAIEGHTDGHGAAGVTSHREFFVRLAQETVRHVSAPTAEGLAYRVDLRLRPAGREGEIALPLAAARAYYRREARPWELQMLIKARPCAGQRELGKQFLRALASRIYPPRADAEVVVAVRATRDRMRARRQTRAGIGDASFDPSLDVKLDRGGIRDIEFLAQGIARRFGGDDPWLRAANTLQALQRLHDKRHLSGRQFQSLSSAYTLLREVEHRLQLRLGQQTHSLPVDPAALEALARSLRRGLVPETASSLPAAPALRAELALSMDRVAALFDELLPAPVSGEGEFQLRSEVAAGEASPTRRLNALRQSSQADLSPHGRRQLDRLLTSLAGHEAAALSFGQWPARVLARLTAVLETSDFLVDALALRPQGWECLLDPLPPPDERQLRLLPATPVDPLVSSLTAEVLASGASVSDRMRALRLGYHARLCRYIAGEVLAPGPIRAALARLTAWAEAAVNAALAVAAAARGVSPACLGVLALGRLGTREFDLLSDADLVFVASPTDLPLATAIASTAVDVLASYTQDGMLFPVDARLRPEGTQGELVHTPHALAEYFRWRANTWEAVSYLKLRPITADPIAGAVAAEAAAAVRAAITDRFTLQPSLRSELRAMRTRIEHDAHSGPLPLKSGPGGSFDLDFILATIALDTGDITLVLNDLPAAFVGLAATDRASLSSARARELADLAAQLRAADHALRIAAGKVPRVLPVPAPLAAAAGRLWCSMCESALPNGDFNAAVAGALARVRAAFADVLR